TRAARPRQHPPRPARSSRSAGRGQAVGWRGSPAGRAGRWARLRSRRDLGAGPGAGRVGGGRRAGGGGAGRAGGGGGGGRRAGAGRPVVVAAVVGGLLLSMLAGVAAGRGHRVNGPAGAVAVGVAAPLLLELLAQAVAGRPGGLAARLGWVGRLGRAAPFARAARFGRVLSGARAGKSQPAPGETESEEAEPDQLGLVVPEGPIRASRRSREGASAHGKAGGTG